MNITFTAYDDKKYTFLHVPKVAGRSVTAYIMSNAKSYTTLHKNSHATLKELKSLNVDLGTTIAIFRNPYSRAVSLYKFLFENNLDNFVQETIKQFNNAPNVNWFQNIREKYKNINFNTFCENIDDMPLKMPQYKYAPVKIGIKVEDGLQILQKILGSNEPIAYLNKGIDVEWTKYYSNNSASKLIYEYYKKDFKFLKYPKKLNNSSI